MQPSEDSDWQFLSEIWLRAGCRPDAFYLSIQLSARPSQPYLWCCLQLHRFIISWACVTFKGFVSVLISMGTRSPCPSPDHIPRSTLTTGQRHCRCCRNAAGCSCCHLKGVAGQWRLPAAEAETLFTSWIFSKDVECDHSGQYGSLIVLDMHRNVLDGLQELVCIPCLETYMARLKKVWNAYLSKSHCKLL